jgi:hypothetical protein
VAPPENSVTNSRADCAPTQQLVGGTKAISPCVTSASAKLFPDLVAHHYTPRRRRVARSARWIHLHRSNALDGAAAALTVIPGRGVAVSLSWSWSHKPQGRARAARERLHPPYADAASPSERVLQVGSGLDAWMRARGWGCAHEIRRLCSEPGGCCPASL